MAYGARVWLDVPMNETTERIARYIASGIPAETAAMLVSYELSHRGRTSTLDTTGKRVAA